MYSYKTSSLSAKSTDIDGSENIRILNFAICTCIYILFFNERKFSAKAFFFFNFLAWHWRGSMAFSLLTTPDYRNTVFIREEFFDLLREVMPGFKILKTVRRLISQTKYLYYLFRSFHQWHLTINTPYIVTYPRQRSVNDSDI